jgi:Tol biopolymer transport system component
MRVITQQTNNEKGKRTNTKLQFISGVVFAMMLVVASSVYAQQSAGVLLQSGLYKEDVNGDLEAAIAIYERVLKEFPMDRPVAAKALLHIGLCYEKLGKQEAQKAYQRLIKEYTDQPEPVQTAREHLKQLDAGAPGAKANGPTYRLAFDSKIAGMPVKKGTLNRRLDFSPSGDRIVFESQGKLYIADKTGTLIRPLLDDFAPWEGFAWPRWSPDGRQIAYVARREVTLDSGEKDSMFALFVLSPDGGTPRQIIPDPERESGFGWLRWTSDGKHLTYLDRGGVHTFALDGSEVRLIPRKDLPGRYRGRSGDAGYSPNGRWLAYCAFMKDPSEEFTTDVWIVPAAGGQAQALRHSPGDRKYPTWAPDGRTLYFVCGTADTGNIWKVAIDPETGLQKGEPQQVTFFNDAEIVFPKVLRDGDQIAFEMERSSTSIHVANGSPPYEPRTLARGRAHLPQVSPDGQTIYYVADGIFAVPREGGTPRRLTETGPLPTHEYLTNFHLSGDGRTLAYIAKLSEGRGLFTLPVSGGEPQLLVKITGLGVVPQWSPDGSQLAYAGGNDLYVIGAAGGQPRKIAHLQDSGRRSTGWDNWTVRWSPGGKFIAAIGYTKKHNGVFVVPASGGELRQLTPDGPDSYYLEGVEWHPDGRRLSYNVDRRESETRQAYLDGRPPTFLVDHPDGWDYIGAWAPDGHRFFYMSEAAGKEGYGIYVYDEASGDITLFADHAAHQSPPRWSRDGKTAAWWVTRKTERQAWIMENFLPESTASK